MLFLVLLLAGAHAQDWNLIWQDEFDGDSLNYDNWSHEVTAWGGGNAEFQVYTPAPENTYIRDGNLYLKTTKLAENINPDTGAPFGDAFLTSGTMDLWDLYGYCTNDNDSGCYRIGQDIPPIASGMVHTTSKFSFRYGRVDINAKMSVGDWLWPAMWLMPQSSVYGGWPMSGEIDMVETIGNRDFFCGSQARGIQHVGSAMHWGASPNDNRYYLTGGSRDNFDQNFGDFFHVYSLVWTPQGIVMSVDDVAVMTVPNPLIGDRDGGNCFTGFYDFGYPEGGPQNPWTDNTCHSYMAPFDQELYLILNVAVGGRWYIPDGCTNKGGDSFHNKPWGNGGSQRDMMQDMYGAQAAWYPTWTSEGENNAMQIDYVRVYQPAEGFPRTQVPAGCSDMPGPDVCP
jgi:beta-glucanase (GH16 family)